jgi:hypothetical protein
MPAAMSCPRKMSAGMLVQDAMAIVMLWFGLSVW